MALAGGLGLAGIVLLIQARPVVTPFPYHMSSRGAFEIKPAARDAPPVPPAALAVPDVPDDAPAIVRGRAVAPAPAWTSPPPPAPVAVPEDAAPPSTGPRALATILRASGLACLGGREALLSPGERELCRERLGAQAWQASSLPAIGPEERAAYDAVARAQAPRRALVPLTARGAGGAFAADDRLRAGRRPRLGCAVRFGPNADKAPDGPASVLRAGPCALQPPGGAPAEDLRRPY